DVEDATVAPDRLVLGDHAFVLNRHLPARERNHPRAESDMPVVEWRAEKRLGHGQTMLTSARKVPLRLCLLRGATGAADRVVGSTGEDEPQEGIAQIPRPRNPKPDPTGTSRPGGTKDRRAPLASHRSTPPCR